MEGATITPRGFEGQQVTPSAAHLSCVNRSGRSQRWVFWNSRRLNEVCCCFQASCISKEALQTHAVHDSNNNNNPARQGYHVTPFFYSFSFPFSFFLLSYPLLTAVLEGQGQRGC